MKVYLSVRTLLMGVLILPVLTNGQNISSNLTSYLPEREGHFIHSEGEDHPIISNVPLNEINIQAFRYFHRHFPAISGESWVKSPEGLIVCFSETTVLYKAFFNKRGAFMYSLKYYRGQDLSNDLQNTIHKNYPGYGIGLVTEINNGERSFYMVKIENSSFIKTLTVCDGKMEVSEELVNARPGSAGAGNWASLSGY